MVNPPWLEELREQLSHQGLPRSYIERLVEEMSDHFNDIMEEKMSKEATNVCSPADRLGLPTDIAQVAATEYRKWFFWRKHPILTFIVMPIPLLVILWVFFQIVGEGIGFVFQKQMREAIGNDPTPILRLALRIVALGILAAPFLISAMILCRLASLSGQNCRWSMLSCGILSVFACFVGFGRPSPFLGGPFSLPQFLMIVMPLATGSWFSWQRVRRQRQLAG
jgi:hypothetical protein